MEYICKKRRETRRFFTAKNIKHPTHVRVECIFLCEKLQVKRLIFGLYKSPILEKIKIFLKKFQKKRGNRKVLSNIYYINNIF